MIRIAACRLRLQDLHLRLPFRYGIATVTDLTHAFVETDVEINGKVITGISAEHLSPKWLYKRPDTSPEADNAELIALIEAVLEWATDLSAETAFGLWQALYEKQATYAKETSLPTLWTHFPVTLVERAVINALGNATQQPFHALLKSNAFGIELASIHPELFGTQPADWLPEAPRKQMILRHTIGMADPLTGLERMDALPKTLEDNIAAYGLKHFKLKLGGNVTTDIARTTEVLAVCAAHAPPDWAFTLDANESYTDFATVRAFWNGLQDTHKARCLFIEQPLHRDQALTDTAGAGLAGWGDHPPILIDESDGALGDFPRALALGYTGTSHKGCKGVFKGVANACLAKKRGALLSGEDLTCVGPVCLEQDLAVMAALGIESVERNGHHYFAGLSMFDTAAQNAALAAHPELYHRSPAGWPTLTITNGAIQFMA
ncbi:enolase C-terminal domain-like protein [Armatimonas sp.]|uniref:enolase C-terminal domain-like protein n=1 Tax=Armatimonas sp. TaxID=1872638 RepID=UPI003751CF3F